MQEQIERYLDACVRVGILTEKKIHKWYLKPGNLAAVVKVYALITRQTFVYNTSEIGEQFKSYKYCITEGGMQWFVRALSQYSFEYLRSTFGLLFAAAPDKSVLDHPQTFQAFNNFYGVTGAKTPAGSKQAALIIHKRQGVIKEHHFKSIKEARQWLLHMSSFYPLTEFTVYRIRRTAHKGTWKEQIPTVAVRSHGGLNDRS